MYFSPGSVGWLDRVGWYGASVTGLGEAGGSFPLRRFYRDPLEAGFLLLSFLSITVSLLNHTHIR